jgi:hypothetical protein
MSANDLVDPSLSVGDVLLRHSCGGRALRHEYVLEDEAERPLARTALGLFGHLRRIETRTRSYHCRGLAIVLRDASATDNLPVAEATIGQRTGTMTLTALPHKLSYAITGARAPTASLVVAYENRPDVTLLTLTWAESTTTTKPGRLGRAILGPCDLDNETLLLVVSVAFHIFAAWFTPKAF